jgi:hypothetical protein
MKAKDSKGRWWEWVDQKAGTKDCGYACAATVCRYYLDKPVAMDLTKGISQMKPGSGAQGGVSDLQNVANVLNSLKVGVWDAEKLSSAAELVKYVRAVASKKTPVILGLNLLKVSHLTVAIDVDESTGTVVFLDPYPSIGLVEQPLSSFPNYFTPRGTGIFTGWILCTKPQKK